MCINIYVFIVYMYLFDIHLTWNVIFHSSSVNGNGVAHHSSYTEPPVVAAPASKRETKKKARNFFATSPLITWDGKTRNYFVFTVWSLV